MKCVSGRFKLSTGSNIRHTFRTGRSASWEIQHIFPNTNFRGRGRQSPQFLRWDRTIPNFRREDIHSSYSMLLKFVLIANYIASCRKFSVSMSKIIPNFDIFDAPLFFHRERGKRASESERISIIVTEGGSRPIRFPISSSALKPRSVKGD